MDKEILFYKVFHNKYLFNKIIDLIQSENIEYNSIEKYHLNNRTKFQNFKKLQLFFKYKQYNLLKDKLISNQFISCCHSSIKTFFETFKNDSDLEMIKLFYVSQKQHLMKYNLIKISKGSNNITSLKYFLNECKMTIDSESLISALESSNFETINYLLNYFLDNNLINDFIREKSIYYASRNMDNKVLETILANFKQFYSKTEVKVNRVGYNVYSQLSIECKRILLQLNQVMGNTRNKIGSLNNLTYQELKFFILEEYPILYEINSNDLIKKVDEIEKIQNDSEKIQSIKKLIAMEIDEQKHLFQYLLDYKDPSIIDKNNYKHLYVYASYTMQLFDLEGLDFFIMNPSLKIQKSNVFNDVSLLIQKPGGSFIKEQISILNEGSKNIEIKKRIIKFFKIYFSQDYLNIGDYFKVCQYLILSPTECISVEFLESLKFIVGFPFNFFIQSDPGSIESIEKLNWYLELCIQFSLRKINFTDCIDYNINSKEYIDFLYIRKNQIKEKSPEYYVFNFNSFELFQYFNSKFKDVLSQKQYISKDLVINAILECNLNNLKIIQDFKIDTFNTPSIFISTWVPYQTQNSKSNSIIIYNYLMDSEFIGLSDNNLYFNIINSLLIDIFETKKNQDTTEPINDFKIFQDNKFQYEIFKILIYNILNLKYEIVEYILKSISKLENYENFLEENSLYLDMEWMDIRSYLQSFNFSPFNSNIDYDRVSNTIKLLLKFLPISQLSNFNSFLNILYKYLLFSNVNLNQVKEIHSLFLSKSIKLTNNSLNIFQYFLIKSQKFKLLFIDLYRNYSLSTNNSNISLEPIYIHIYGSIIKENLQISLNSLLNQNFNIDLILNSNFKELYLLLIDKIFDKDNKHDGLVPYNKEFDEINYLVSIGEYDIIQYLINNDKIKFSNYSNNNYSNHNVNNYDNTKSINHIKLYSLFLPILSISNFSIIKSFIDKYYSEYIDDILLSSIEVSRLEVVQYIFENYSSNLKPIISTHVLSLADYQVFEYLINNEVDLISQKVYSKLFLYHYQYGNLQETILIKTKKLNNQIPQISDKILRSISNNGFQHMINYYHKKNIYNLN